MSVVSCARRRVAGPLLLRFGWASACSEARPWMCWLLCGGRYSHVVCVPLFWSQSYGGPSMTCSWFSPMVAPALPHPVFAALGVCLQQCIVCGVLPFRFVRVAHRLFHVGVALVKFCGASSGLGSSVKRRSPISLGSGEGWLVEGASC